MEAAIANNYREVDYDSNTIFSNVYRFIVCLENHCVKFVLIEDVPVPVVTLSAVFSQEM